MKELLPFLLILFLGACTPSSDQDHTNHNVADTTATEQYALILHGGAGGATPEGLGEEGVRKYTAALDTALDTGLAVLEQGGSSLDAVTAVITYMEDNPVFNAGRGAVLSSKGIAELDASVMEGDDLNAGAVAGIQHTRNPILAARKVMEESPYVMLATEGADEFARSKGLTRVDHEYFITGKSKRQLERAKEQDKWGTVGCVALDRKGRIAAGTSTGGRNNKLFGRVGDSPVIGAGTYASSNVAGVSCTGEGEFFIRLSIAHDVIATMEYKNLSVEQAANEVLSKLDPLNGKGGMICLDKHGNPAMVFNTSAMFRAYGNASGDKEVAIF